MVTRSMCWLALASALLAVGCNRQSGDAGFAGQDAVLQCSVDTDCMLNRVCDGGRCKLHESGGVIDDAMTDILPSRMTAAIKLLAPYKARNDDSDYGLTVTPGTGHSNRFLEGERVVVKLQQANYDGYLYVDYFSVDGNVAHIYPNTSEPGSGRLIAAREQFEIGASKQKFWTVGPPFGQELVTVIASPTPLYEGAHMEVQETKDYLPRLRQMLEANQGNPRLTSAYLLIETAPHASASSRSAPSATTAALTPDLFRHEAPAAHAENRTYAPTGNNTPPEAARPALSANADAAMNSVASHPQQIRVDNTDPGFLYKTEPVYPLEERRRGIQGISVVIVSIDTNGNVQGVEVRQSSGNRNLDRAAVRTAREWRFSPEIRDGQPVPSRMRVPIIFSL